MEKDALMTKSELSKLTGVDARTIDYYSVPEKEGRKGCCALLKHVKTTDSGYRLYDQTAVETLWKIQLYRELDYSIKAIKDMLNNPNPLSAEMLEDQITKLEKNKEKAIKRYDEMINFAKALKDTGGHPNLLDNLARFAGRIPIDAYIQINANVYSVLEKFVSQNESQLESLMQSDMANELLIKIEEFPKIVYECGEPQCDSIETQQEVQQLYDLVNGVIESEPYELISILLQYIVEMCIVISSTMIEISTSHNENVESDSNTEDIEFFELTKKALLIILDWICEAQSINEVFDIEAFAKSRSELALELNRKYGEDFFDKYCIATIMLFNEIGVAVMFLFLLKEGYKAQKDSNHAFAVNAIEHFINKAIEKTKLADN